MRNTTVIPLEVFFENPAIASVQLSNNGKYLSYLAPLEGVLNIWIRTIGLEDDHPITHNTGRGIQEYFWAANSEQIVFLQDTDGDENWKIFSVQIIDGAPILLTPFENVQAEILKTDPAFPDEILIGLNNRDPQVHDVYKLHLRTKELTLLVQNDIGAAGWCADNRLHVRVALVPTASGGVKLLHRAHTEDWKEILHWEIEDANNTGIVGFAKDNKSLRMISSIGSNAGALCTLDTETAEMKTIASDPNYDASRLLLHPQTQEIQAVGFTREKLTWEILDPTVQPHFNAIHTLHRGEFEVVDRDLSDKTWLIKYMVDDGPVAYYSYDTTTMNGNFLFHHRPELNKYKLSEMKPVTFPARDGLQLHGYLSVPVGVEAKNLPTILNVHGGPWARDYWGFNPEVQWLTNRGYAVLQINFRGSTGYGKSFTNAGDKEWGGKMQDDISDGVNWLIANGIADPKRVAIFGASFGGYATLTGIVKTPELYACGVDVVGPSNLFSFLKNIPPYWEIARPLMERRIGKSDRDAEMLRERSPLFHIDKIKCPLLIAQGSNDPRVPKAESIQIRDAMVAAGLKVTYLEFENEGHGFARPENRMKFYSVMEQFLSEHMA